MRLNVVLACRRGVAFVVAAMGPKPLLKLVVAANYGMTTADKTIRAWLEETARHPKFNRAYRAGRRQQWQN